MSREHVTHTEIARFAQERVNLPKEKANEFRAQAKGLRDRLENYLGEHPDFTLKKMLLAGSLAKGTALRTLNDIDVACYIVVPAKFKKQLHGHRKRDARAQARRRQGSTDACSLDSLSNAR